MSEQYLDCLDKMSEVNFSPAETLQSTVLQIRKRYKMFKVIAEGDILQIQKIFIVPCFTLILKRGWKLWGARKSGTLCVISSEVLSSRTV